MDLYADEAAVQGETERRRKLRIPVLIAPGYDRTDVSMREPQNDMTQA